MKDCHKHTETDRVVAAVVMKAAGLASAWGEEIVKVKVKDQDESGDARVYFENAVGRVIDAFVRDKQNDGRQFIDCEIYTFGGSDYQQWHCSSLENFSSAIEEQISAELTPTMSV